MYLVIVIVIACAAVAAAVICAVVVITSQNKSGRKSKRKIVYLCGGVDIDTLKIMHETPFSPNITDTGTVTVNEYTARTDTRIIISNLSTGTSETYYIEGELVVGRTPGEGGCRISDPSASKCHFSLSIYNGELYVRDLNSSNHTFVNNIQLESGASAQLKSGSVIRAGKTELKITVK